MMGAVGIELRMVAALLLSSYLVHDIGPLFDGIEVGFLRRLGVWRSLSSTEARHFRKAAPMRAASPDIRTSVMTGIPREALLKRPSAVPRPQSARLWGAY